MDKDSYIKQLEEKIIQLENRIKELERRLGMNSKNSSKPPSTDPPGPSAAQPKRRRKKRGGQKGHPPHLKTLLPASMVQRFIPLKPLVCTCGSTHLEPTREPPQRHQYVDIPPITPRVWEYQQLLCRCKDCGALIYAPLPDGIKRCHFGPGVLAIVGVLTVMLNSSKRKATAVLNDVFNVPISVGGLSNCEARLTVCATCRLQKRSIIEYLRHACHNHLKGTDVPSLLQRTLNCQKIA